MDPRVAVIRELVTLTLEEAELVRIEAEKRGLPGPGLDQSLDDYHRAVNAQGVELCQPPK